MAAQFLSVVGFSCFHPFLSLYVQELGIEGGAGAAAFVGVMLFANSAILAVLAPLWGAVSDRVGPKMMAQRALIGSAVLCALMGAARSPIELLVVFAALGAVSGVMVALTTLASAIAPLSQVGRAIGFMQAAVFTGTAIGPLAAGIVANLIGYRQLFLVSGAFLLVGGLLVTVFTSVPGRSGKAKPSLGSSLRYAVTDRPLLAITLLVFLLQVGALGVSPVIPIFVQEMEADPARVNEIVGISFGLTGLAGAVGAIWIARLAERHGHSLVLVIISALGAMFHLPTMLAVNPIQLILFRGLFGTMFGGFLPVTGAMTARVVPPERHGIAYGITGSAFALGNGIGPLAIGAAVGVIGVRGVFALEAAVLLAAAVVARLCGGALTRKIESLARATEVIA